MIRQYSLAKDGNRKLAPSFNTREFRCRDGTDTILVDEALTVVLQCIREHFGKAVIHHLHLFFHHRDALGKIVMPAHLPGQFFDLVLGYRLAFSVSDQHADQGHRTGKNG